MIDIDAVIKKSRDLKISAKPLMDADLYEQCRDIFAQIARNNDALQSFEDSFKVNYSENLILNDFLEDQTKLFKAAVVAEVKEKNEKIKDKVVMKIINFYNLEKYYQFISKSDYYSRIDKKNHYHYKNDLDEIIFSLKDHLKITTFHVGRYEQIYDDVKCYKVELNGKIVKFVNASRYNDNSRFDSSEERKFDKLIEFMGHFYTHFKETFDKNIFMDNRGRFYYNHDLIQNYEQGEISKFQLFQNTNFKITFVNSAEATTFFNYFDK